MKRFIPLALAMLLISSAFLWSNDKTHYFKEANAEILIPDSWYVEEDIDGISISSDDDNVTISFLIIDAVSLEEAMEIAEQSIADELTEFESIKAAKTTISNRDAVLAEAKASDEEDFAYFIHYLVLNSDDQKYLLAVSVTEMDIVVDYAGTIKEILKNISVK